MTPKKPDRLPLLPRDTAIVENPDKPESGRDGVTSWVWIADAGDWTLKATIVSKNSARKSSKLTDCQ